MDNTDLERLSANQDWFEKFYGDLEYLFQKMAKALSAEFPLPKKGFYYPKFKHRPSMPPYYVLGLGGGDFSVQVYAVLNSALFEDQDGFDKKVSFIVVKHSRGDQYLFLDDYGLQIIRSRQKDQKKVGDIIAGEISGGAGKGTKFRAFQAPLDPFVGASNVNQAIQTHIVDKLRSLPGW